MPGISTAECHLGKGAAEPDEGVETGGGGEEVEQERQEAEEMQVEEKTEEEKAREQQIVFLQGEFDTWTIVFMSMKNNPIPTAVAMKTNAAKHPNGVPVLVAASVWQFQRPHCPRSVYGNWCVP